MNEMHTSAHAINILVKRFIGNFFLHNRKEDIKKIKHAKEIQAKEFVRFKSWSHSLTLNIGLGQRRGHGVVDREGDGTKTIGRGHVEGVVESSETAPIVLLQGTSYGVPEILYIITEEGHVSCCVLGSFSLQSKGKYPVLWIKEEHTPKTRRHLDLQGGNGNVKEGEGAQERNPVWHISSIAFSAHVLGANIASLTLGATA